MTNGSMQISINFDRISFYDFNLILIDLSAAGIALLGMRSPNRIYLPGEYI
ncbi:MAG: hypothetical protein ACFE0I_14420 [Elainellaceae cyanobacterium]